MKAALPPSTLPRDTLYDKYQPYNVFTAYIGYYNCKIKLYPKNGDRF